MKKFIFFFPLLKNSQFPGKIGQTVFTKLTHPVNSLFENIFKLYIFAKFFKYFALFCPFFKNRIHASSIICIRFLEYLLTDKTNRAGVLMIIIHKTHLPKAEIYFIFAIQLKNEQILFIKPDYLTHSVAAIIYKYAIYTLHQYALSYETDLNTWDVEFKYQN